MTILQRNAKEGVRRVGEVVQERIEFVQAKKDSGETGLPGIETPFDEVNYLTSGLQNGELIIVAARSAMGKSAFSLQLALHAAQKTGKPALFYSLEMSPEMLVDRIISSEAMVSATMFRRGLVSDEEWGRIQRVGERFHDTPLYIIDTASPSIAQIRAQAQSVQSTAGLSMVVVDYLQLIYNEGKSNDSRAIEVDKIARGLKMMAKGLNVPVVVLSQLSRAVENRSDKRPQLSDLKDSSGVENNADVVLFLFRPKYYEKDTENSIMMPDEDAYENALVIVGKNRNGPTGEAEVGFVARYAKFVNVERNYEE
jgi:replicative DNA helicase